MSAQVAADLRAAAEVLERDGWTQGAFKRDDGARCAAQAITFVIDETDEADEDDGDGWDDWTAVRWSNALNALSSYVDNGVFTWNDAPGRTADEVIAALEAAADAAEAQ